MDTWECLYERRSIREFIPRKPVPEAMLEKLLWAAWYSLPAAAVYEPNYFPWRFIINREDSDIRNTLADAAAEVAASIFGNRFEFFGPGHLWYMTPEVQLRVAEYTTTGELWRYNAEASINFIPLVGKGWLDTLGAHSQDYGALMQYIGFATMNMWLVGHKYGLVGAYNGMPFLDERRREILCEHLCLPRSWDGCGALGFGYASHPRYFGPTRSSLEGYLFDEVWGNPYVRLAFRGKDYKVELPKTEIEDVIKHINYVENFEEEPIPDWKVEMVADIGRWGPMPEMLKNWRGILIKDQKSKDFLQSIRSEKIADQWTGVWAERMYASARGTPEEKLEEVERILDYKMGNTLSEAYALILMYTTDFTWTDQPDVGWAQMPQHMFQISTGACIQNMFVAATALGLGLNYDTIAVGDMRGRELVADYFGIPHQWYPLGILALGTPGKPQKIHRQSIDILFSDELWGNWIQVKSQEPVTKEVN